MRIWSRATTARSSSRGAVREVLVEQLPAGATGGAIAEPRPHPGVDRAPALGDLRLDAVDVEVDVDPVHDGLLVAVLHDEVLVEEAERLLVRGRGEPDGEGVEVVEHLPPEAVDRAVALVDDHDVEELGRQLAVVLDGEEPGGELEGRVLVDLLVERGLAAEDRVDPLDRGDRHARDGVDVVRGEVLDVVELGELAPVVRRREALELLQRLAAEVGAVDEEEDPARVGVLDEAVGDVGRGEGLAGAGRHLDQRARAVRGERLLEVADGRDLRGPEARLSQRRQRAQAVSQRGCGGMLRDVREPAGKRLRPVEREHRAARGVGVERVREAGLGPGRLVGERERALDAVGISSGRPSTYFALCHSTPVSVSPSFFASITPTADPSTKSR